MLDESDVLRALATRAIVPDASQRSAIAAMLTLLGGRATDKPRAGPTNPLGVYCHGLPGRGKSLVMDTVYALARCPKTRIHFHEFLREIIRRQTSSTATGGDSLVDNARDWLGDAALLCFDEFHVHDIADAFLIGRFLDTALAMGIAVVLTSNYPPDGLLPDPLFHDRFQPTITRIKNDFAVIHFDGAHDYRFDAAPAAIERLMAPLNAETAQRLRMCFEDAEGGAAPHPATLHVAGRSLQARAAGELMLWADFDELCVASRSHLDYLALPERWQALIVDDLLVERLTSPATLQRLIWLVDIFYDRKLMMYIASDQALAAALAQLAGARDLSRTLSRLVEMQSRDDGAAHRAQANVVAYLPTVASSARMASITAL